jgi:flagellar protein FlgJ
MKISNDVMTGNINQIKTKSAKSNTEDFKKILEEAKNSNDKEKLEATCKQFESIYINILMQNMRKTVGDGGLIEKSHARKMFEGMLDEEISKEVSKGQGMGLAQIMYQQLSQKNGIDEDDK